MKADEGSAAALRQTASALGLAASARGAGAGGLGGEPAESPASVARGGLRLPPRRRKRRGAAAPADRSRRPTGSRVGAGPSVRRDRHRAHDHDPARRPPRESLADVVDHSIAATVPAFDKSPPPEAAPGHRSLRHHTMFARRQQLQRADSQPCMTQKRQTQAIRPGLLRWAPPTGFEPVSPP
jgi:hypothetical protein